MKKILILLCASVFFTSCTFGKTTVPEAGKGQGSSQNDQKNNVVIDGNVATPSKPADSNLRIPLLIDVPNPQSPPKNQLEIK